MRIVSISSSLILMFVVLSVPGVSADSITIGGVSYDGVYLRETDAMFYVQIPADGSVLSVPKEQASEVEINPNETERQAILAQWKATRVTPEPANATESIAPATVEIITREPSRLELPVVRGSEHLVPRRLDTYVDRADLRGVPLGEGLRALLRGMSLDYTVENGVLYITTPDRMNQASFRQLETRIFQLQQAGETLPKIVVANPGGGQSATMAFGGSGFSTGGGFGTGGGGQGGFGGGQGGFGGGQGGFGGGQGGFGGGQGGFGGGGQGGFGGQGAVGGQAFSNISQLFTTIDDRRVGESPNAIVMQYGGAR